MSIRFECSDCGKSLKVKDDHAGRKMRCPVCEAVNQVPVNETETDDRDERSSRSRSSSKSSRSGTNRSGSSRSEQSRRSPSRRGRTSDDDNFADLPRTPKRRKASKKSE